jgi:hypothetical protein
LRKRIYFGKIKKDKNKEMVQELGKNKNLAAGKKVRSRAYPALDLRSAILAAKKIFDDLGQGPHSRAALARGLGYGGFCGAVSVRIGALAHFGLLEKFAGNYSISPAALALFDFHQKDRQKEIFAAAATPALFAALAARFAGGALPKNLPAILTADYDIAANAAPAAAKNFAATFEFAGVLKNNRLILPDAGHDDFGDSEAENERADGKVPVDDSAAMMSSENIEVKLSSGIIVLFPKKFASRLALGEFAQELKNLDGNAGL